MVIKGCDIDAPDIYELAAKMKYMEGKTWAQIGRSLSLSRGTLDSVKRRMRRDMSKVLEIMEIMRR